jgi:hypothetical protein
MRRLSLRRLVVVGVAGLLLALLNVPPALAQPANDDFDSATVISSLPFTDSISTVDATNPGDDPFCNGFEHTVWYSFTPTQDTTVRADTAGSDYATSLGVYTGSRGALSEVACASSPAEVSFNASADTTYFFMVASAAGGPGGTLAFHVSEGPPTLTVSLTGRATLVAKGAAVDVEFVHSCSPGLDGGMIVNLTQRVGGKLLATGFGIARDFICDNAEHTATVSVIAETAPFKKGDAVAEGTFEGCSPGGCLFVRMPTATVRIK